MEKENQQNLFLRSDDPNTVMVMFSVVLTVWWFSLRRELVNFEKKHSGSEIHKFEMLTSKRSH